MHYVNCAALQKHLHVGHAVVAGVQERLDRAAVHLQQHRPAWRSLSVMAERWSPWRSVAATLFWGYYSARKNSRKLPL